MDDATPLTPAQDAALAAAYRRFVTQAEAVTASPPRVDVETEAAIRTEYLQAANAALGGDPGGTEIVDRTVCASIPIASFQSATSKSNYYAAHPAPESERRLHVTTADAFTSGHRAGQSTLILAASPLGSSRQGDRWQRHLAYRACGVRGWAVFSSGIENTPPADNVIRRGRAIGHQTVFALPAATRSPLIGVRHRDPSAFSQQRVYVYVGGSGPGSTTARNDARFSLLAWGGIINMELRNPRRSTPGDHRPSYADAAQHVQAATGSPYPLQRFRIVS